MSDTVKEEVPEAKEKFEEGNDEVRPLTLSLKRADIKE